MADGYIALDMLVMVIEAERELAYERGRWLRELRKLERNSRMAGANVASRSHSEAERSSVSEVRAWSDNRASW